ncbi:hypothetical protein [Marinobacter nauticus]|uniref:hypothetical protein n=1 Tax=Marinobacter nauticus TaxID=2743 RepID=UPI0003100C52|nr:hypothetical protein [Marinobacter nauticus]
MPEAKKIIQDIENYWEIRISRAPENNRELTNCCAGETANDGYRSAISFLTTNISNLEKTDSVKKQNPAGR